MSEAGCKAEFGRVAVSDGSASMMTRRQNHADFRYPTKAEVTAIKPKFRF